MARYLYKYSRSFDVHRRSDFPEVSRALDQVFQDVVDYLSQDRRRLHRRNLRKHVHALVLDIYVASTTPFRIGRRSIPLYVGISLRSEDYTHQESRYKKVYLSYRHIKTALDALVGCGYVKKFVGYFDRDRGRGHQTRVRARSRLLRLIKHHRVVVDMVMPEDTETIILHDRDGGLVEYDDTEDTALMRANLARINHALAKAHLDLDLTVEQWEELERRVAGGHSPRPVNFRRKFLKRIFINTSFEEGGRFYGGWWENIPREFRKYISINHKSTIEFDYSGLHIRMLYAMENLDVPNDPYDIEGIPRGDQKKAILIAINAGSEPSARRALAQERIEGHDRVLDAVLVKHAAIGRYFFSGIGNKLQCIDARIAEKVMLRMLDRGAVILPVHDSFVTRDSSVWLDELREEMVKAFQEEFPDALVGIEAKESWRDAASVENGNPGEPFLFVTDDLDELARSYGNEYRRRPGI